MAANQDKTPEQLEWERVGCSNKEEYREHLNKSLWRHHAAGLSKKPAKDDEDD